MKRIRFMLMATVKAMRGMLRECRPQGAVILAAALMVGGCQTMPAVNSDAKPGTDFSVYKTFAVLPVKSAAIPSDPGAVLRVGGVAEQAAKDALTAKGFQSVPLESAELAVRLIGQAFPKMDITGMGYGSAGAWRGRYPGGYHNIEVDTYEERTLAIEIYDNRNKDLVWVGWATRMGEYMITAETVRESVNHVLSVFPPQPAQP